MRGLGRWLVAAVVLVLGRGRRRRLRRRERPRIIPRGLPSPRAETVVLGLLGVTTICAIAFIVVYAIDRIPAQTQFQGLALGLAFAALSAAAVIAGKRLIVSEEIVEPYPEATHQEEQEAIAQIVHESGDGLTRKRLLAVAAGGAGTALGAALLAPAVSLGPLFDTGRLKRTPWHAGVQLVDEAGRPLREDEIEEKQLYTAFPNGATRNEVSSPVVLVRLPADELQLPAGRQGWAPGGIVAYSKICTHAGCAVSLYRAPLYEPTSFRPALVCPCHYSTFDPATGAAVLFGPAGRPLPQLPLKIEGGRLVAAGGFSGAVGPSWSGVRGT